MFAAAFVSYVCIACGLYLLHSAWAAILGYHATLALALAASQRRTDVRSLFRGWRLRVGLPLCAISPLGGALVYVLWPLISLRPGSIREPLSTLHLAGGAWTAFALYYGAVNPFLEEWFWRERFPRSVRWPWTADALYAGYHVLVLLLFLGMLWSVLAGAILWVVALVWRRMREHYGGLAVPAVAHLVGDLGVIAAVFALRAQ